MAVGIPGNAPSPENSDSVSFKTKRSSGFFSMGGVSPGLVIALLVVLFLLGLSYFPSFTNNLNNMVLFGVIAVIVGTLIFIIHKATDKWSYTLLAGIGITLFLYIIVMAFAGPIFPFKGSFLDSTITNFHKQVIALSSSDNLIPIHDVLKDNLNINLPYVSAALSTVLFLFVPNIPQALIDEIGAGSSIIVLGLLVVLFILVFADIFRSFSTLSPGFDWGVAIILAIVMGQIGFIRQMALVSIALFMGLGVFGIVLALASNIVAFFGFEMFFITPLRKYAARKYALKKLLHEEKAIGQNITTAKQAMTFLKGIKRVATEES